MTISRTRRRRAPRTRDVRAGAGCPECGRPGIEYPGFVEWRRRFELVMGHPAPADPPPFVPDYAWWWCSACHNGGAWHPSQPLRQVG